MQIVIKILWLCNHFPWLSMPGKWSYWIPSLSVTHGSHSFTDKKSRTFLRLSRTPMNFPGSFRSPRMFKYKEKTAFTYNIQSVVHCRKFSMKQNVLHYCCLFSIWTTRKMHDFQGYFSRTLSFNFQDQSDFPGLSRSWNFQEKTKTFQEAWEPWWQDTML